VSTDANPTSPVPRARGSALLAAARLTLIFLATLLYFSCFLVQRFVTRDPRRRLATGAHWTRRWARRALRLMGIRVEPRGPQPPPGSFIAPNHFTWLDVIALMGNAPMFFVANDGVARWPVVGFFTRQVGTVFIRRSRVSRGLTAAARQVRERLAAGVSIVVFLEGTTSDGRDLLPFRPSLLQTAIDAGARVVPTALRWRADRPGVSVEDDVGYFRDDQVFARQAWRLMGLSGVACEIRFGDPIDAAGRDRKELAPIIETEVRRLRDDGVKLPESR
jgi:1-acyl-sn-glycerol-3-phosphate acyltransferase